MDICRHSVDRNLNATVTLYEAHDDVNLNKCFHFNERLIFFCLFFNNFDLYFSLSKLERFVALRDEDGETGRQIGYEYIKTKPSIALVMVYNPKRS